ncbi:AI-2E family transporter [Neochlamydia sp. EPS4]|uniref:AI-2E family transporter n=1 Tax=Neochlamydia sp. EPS4 TaxID=1478175 RepID=UPI0005D130EA|nr:AI-2E family transporter [Neochlamydia sp. EPS4]
MWYNQKFFSNALSSLVILLTLFIGFQLFPFFKLVFQFVTTLLLPVIIAGLFYYIFRPIVRYLDQTKIPRYLIIIFIYLFVMVAGSLLISIVWPYIEKQITAFRSFPQQKLKEVENKTVDLMNVFNFYSLSPEQLRNLFYHYLQEITQWASGGIVSSISSLTTVASYFIITPFILYYFLKDDQHASEKFISHVPFVYRERVTKALNDIDEILSSYISGQIIIAFIVGVLVFIGYWGIGLDYAFLLALIAGLFNLIPFFGTLISTLPALLVGLTSTPFMGLKVLAIVLIVHLIDLNFISPRIVGKRLNIHPITIIILLATSASLFGFWSLFFIVPLYAILKTLSIDLWERNIAEKMAV